jgi:hypothetical protein
MSIIDSVIRTITCSGHEGEKQAIFDRAQEKENFEKHKVSVADAQFRTITCDGPGCDKQIAYDRTQEKQTFEKPENVWLRSTRVTQTADGRNIVYCSDTCEVKGAATGTHNIPEPPKIITAANPAAIAAAAQAAANARQADAAIREGQSVKVKLS